jgi:hypothetical protein
MQFAALGAHYLYARLSPDIFATTPNDPRSTKGNTPSPPVSHCAAVQLCKPRHIKLNTLWNVTPKKLLHSCPILVQKRLS